MIELNITTEAGNTVARPTVLYLRYINMQKEAYDGKCIEN